MATIPLWPLNLPCRLAFGVGIQAQDNAIRFQPEIGDEKVRRRSTQKLVDHKGLVLLRTRAEIDQFREFYDETLYDGTIPFRYDDLLDCGAAIFRFTETPEWSEMAPNKWQVSVTMRRIS